MINKNTLNKLIHSLFQYSIFIIMIDIAVSCGQVPENDQVIIRAGDSVITGEYLNQVIEIAKTSYPTNISDKKMVQLRQKVIAELMEEVLIMERAREMGICISDNELEKAVMSIKKDYPENTFENMLLEQAIPFGLWKERLRKRLLIDKTIETDLKKNITISQKDIESFHHRYPKQSISPIGDHPLKNEIVKEATNSQEINSFLMKEKIEDSYNQWIKELKERYGLYLSFDRKSDA